jgi:glutaminyl-peptide cyclotransferase
MARPDRKTLALVAITIISLGAVLAAYFAPHSGNGEALSQKTTTAAPQKNPIDGDAAYKMLKDICAIGPRKSGSPGMAKQQELLIAHFRKLGAQVSTQDFDVRDPQSGAKVTMKNIIVEWHPEKKERVLLCTHYDTRPYPDEDPRRPRGKFIGANDGASGPALLSELGRHMGELEIPYGVDFVLFDGEELVYDRARDKYFLGSEHFAKSYVAEPPAHRYLAGVLLDMVGDKNLELYYEGNSMLQNPAIAREIWKTALRLKVKEFIPRTKHTVSDDHLALSSIARIPSIDIIDFDYPRQGAASFWHTEADTPDKCSAASLAKVGWVLLEWLKGLE